MIKWFSIFLFLAGVFGNLSAGDTSRLHIIGFSDNGAYFAYERYGIEEGSLDAYSEVFIIDVAKNMYALPPLRIKGSIDTTHLTEIREQNIQAAARFLESFKIDRRIKGELVVYHPYTDLTYQDTRQYFSTADDSVRFLDPTDFRLTGEHPEYTLLLKHFPDKRICPIWEEPAQLMELILKSGAGSKTLQKDAHLPGSRGCVLCYRIERVYVYKDRIVVFLAATLPGFEGFSIRHVVVSGTLKIPSK